MPTSPDDSTEVRIQKAAKTIFTRKGLAGARMQDIADEAGINKALLHYYYRSKQKLFEMIFEEKLIELFTNLQVILESDLPFDEKIKSFIEKESDLLSEFPSLPIFVLSEAWQNPDYVERLLQTLPIKLIREKFKKLHKEAADGDITHEIPFHQFMINMMSMIIYPIVARPLIMPLFGLDEKDFANLMEQRKSIISKILLENKPKDM